MLSTPIESLCDSNASNQQWDIHMTMGKAGQSAAKRPASPLLRFCLYIQLANLGDVGIQKQGFAIVGTHALACHASIFGASATL